MADVMTAPRQAAGAAGPALLEIRGMEAWYGESHVLHGVDMDVREGEVVTLLGRNGAGKTSTLRSIMGVVPKRSGSMKYEGREMIGARSDAIARAGSAYCPEERGIFASLEVTENLMLPPTVRPRPGRFALGAGGGGGGGPPGVVLGGVGGEEGLPRI